MSKDQKENQDQGLEQEMEDLKETMAIYLGFLIKEIVKEFGDRGREAVKEAARKGGLYQGKKYLKDNNVKERGTKAFAEFFSSMSDVDLFKVKVDEPTDKRCVIRTNTCPYIKYWKEIGIPEELPEFCVLATYYDLGLAQAFNPKLSIELPVDMIRGDCECEYVFVEKE